MTSLILKNGKESSVKRLHPWVFSGAVREVRGSVAEGDVVNVLDSSGEFLARGHYQPDSITVRILTFSDIPVDAAFWNLKIGRAFASRQAIGITGNPSTNVFRLIHGEGDGLPGLIVDVYDTVAVMQCHSAGMYLSKMEIARAILDVCGGTITSVFDKSEGTLPFKAPIKAKNGYVLGEGPSKVLVQENGLKFSVDVLEGQKTGLFIDQRFNRQLVGQYSKGRTVANLFGYTGGFSLYALQAGAKLVHSVDSSAKAIEATIENVRLNGFEGDRHEAFAQDVFDFLKSDMIKYDLIILDPPAFAKHNSSINNAVQGYKRLNARAIKAIEPGGILFTFSCSQVISPELFRQTVFVASAGTGREVKVLHRLSQPEDHPVSVYHPEGEYLKGLVLQVF